MNDRKKTLLTQIIKEHIKTALPVGSKLLENKSNLGVSSATIRNEMAELEKEGFIVQPHTSAGRVPTAKGYRYFLDNFFAQGKLSAKEEREIADQLKKYRQQSAELAIRQVAKKMAEVSDNAVIAAFSDRDFYYTGLSNLFGQPEFYDISIIQDISGIIDHLDQVIAEIFDQIKTTTVRIGKENPFGSQCSIIIGPWKFKQQRGIMGILGPMRMNYERNIGLIDFISKI